MIDPFTDDPDHIVAPEFSANPRRNKYFSIEIEHLPTESKIQFDGWVTQFADNFISQWKGTPAYGRMDDLYTFQRTGRKISLSFDVPAADDSEGALNQFNLNRLSQFLYPVYSDDADPNFQVVNAAPLLKMSWSGLIQDAKDGKGLVGFLQGFSYSPVIEQGPLITKNGDTADYALMYKHHSVQLEFTVLHTHNVGWVTSTDGLGGSKYSFGDSTDGRLGKYFPHVLTSQFDPAKAGLDGEPNQYVDQLPSPTRTTGESLRRRGEADLAMELARQQRRAAQEQAQQLRVTSAGNARTNRQNRRWNRTHPNSTPRPEGNWTSGNNPYKSNAN